MSGADLSKAREVIKAGVTKLFDDVRDASPEERVVLEEVRHHLEEARMRIARVNHQRNERLNQAARDNALESMTKAE